MCLSWGHKPVWAGVKDHSKMNTTDEYRTLFRALENNIHPYRIDGYWDKDDNGYQIRLMFTMFRVSLFDWKDI